MASSKAKWWIGCGLGCAGLFVVMVVLAVAGTASLMRETTSGFEVAVVDGAELQQLGARAPYVPTPDGRIPAQRIEAFLAVREATRPAREGIARFFEAIPTSREEAEALEAKPTLEKLGTVFGLTRSAFGLGRDLGDLLRLRNRALLEADMGLDEYTYLYVLVYTSWLGHPIDSGPPIDGDDRSGMLDDDVLDRIGERLRAMLAAQAVAAREAGAGEAWIGALADELARLEADPAALPWEHELPEPIATSLEPYRDALAAGFSRSSNPFELGVATKRGRFSFGVQ